MQSLHHSLIGTNSPTGTANMADSEYRDAEQDVAAEVDEEVVADQSSDESAPETQVSPAELREDGESGMEAADATGTAWQQELENAGFQSFDDIDNAVKALVESNKQRDEQIQTYADQIRYYQDQIKFGQANHTAHQQEQPNSQQPVDPLTELVQDWQDPNWANQWIEIDEEGNRVISDAADDETREKILNIDRKLRAWQEVLQDPRRFTELVDKRVDQMIQEKFESSYQQKQTQASEDQAVNSFVNENASWLYQQDPATGQYLRDPVTGDLVYSSQGNEFLGHMNALKEDGVSSVSKQIEYAKRVMGVVSPQAARTQHQDAGSTAQQRRNEMRGRTNTSRGRQTSFNGVTARSGGDQTGMDQRSFGERTLAAMMAGDE